MHPGRVSGVAEGTTPGEEEERVNQTIDGQAVVVYEPQQERSVTLFGTNNPVELVQRATAIANALAPVIRQKKLFTTIGGREHVHVDGWSFLGTMLGVYPVLAWSREIPGGFEARVEAKARDGSVVGAAECQCTREEKTWSSRDDHSLRSMAETRAASKALRLPLGFVMTLAGYDPTPAEEMTREQQPQRGARATESRKEASEPPTEEEKQKYAAGIKRLEELGVDVTAYSNLPETVTREQLWATLTAMSQAVKRAEEIAAGQVAF